MSAYRDQTRMGGTASEFLTTHWSLVENIQSGEDRDRALISLLLKRYWKPVYCYLRHKGCDNEEAKDLTQGFFHEVVLDHGLVQRVDSSKGRFRTLLLHALDHYLISHRRKQHTQKRLPRGKLVPLEFVDPPSLPQNLSKLDPEDSYNYGWTASMLDQILTEVEAACLEDDMETHWLVFQDKVVQPILTDTSGPSFAELCEKYAIRDLKTASNMITTVKRRLHKALKNYLRAMAGSDSEMNEDFREILRFFAKGKQSRK